MRITRQLLVVSGMIGLLAGMGQAQTPRNREDSLPAVPATTKSGARPAPRGPLPDPALLDGAAQPAEKRAEYGMLGEFEIPGDPDSKSDRVGGGRSGAQGQQKPQQPGVDIQLPGIPLPSMGGPSSPDGAKGGGIPSMGLPSGASGAAGGSNGLQIPQVGQQGGAGLAGGQPVDPSKANGQGGGTQVAELKTDEANAGGVGGEPAAPKPGQVAIGDPAMQIKGAQNAPGVIGGAVSAGSTQQMEKAVGGGKGGGGSGDNSNKGVEKGRVVPAGL